MAVATKKKTSAERRRKAAAKERQGSATIDADEIPDEVAALAESEAAYLDFLSNHASPECSLYGHNMTETGEKYFMANRTMETVRVECSRNAGCTYHYWIDVDRGTRQVLRKSSPKYGPGYLKPAKAKLAAPGRVSKEELRQMHGDLINPPKATSAAPDEVVKAFQNRWSVK
jgi:hypothetical protein